MLYLAAFLFFILLIMQQKLIKAVVSTHEYIHHGILFPKKTR